MKWLFAALSVACARPAPQPPVAPFEPAPAEPTEVQVHMQEHFAFASAARDAVIGGDLPEAWRIAEWVVAHEPWKDMPDRWRPFIAEMKEMAVWATRAKDMDGVAAAVSGMAAACGECHADVGGGPRLEQLGDPPKADPRAGDPAGGMVRHQWAASAMWEGLITADLERYRAGALELGSAPLRPYEIGETDIPEVVLRYEEAVVESARVAAASDDEEERIREFGRVLALCARCHTALGAGP